MNEERELEATLTSKGQATIPKGVRDKLGLRPGDKLVFTRDRRGYRVAKRRGRRPLDRWVGHLAALQGRDPDELVRETRGH